MKPGYLTTEFWLTIAAFVLTALFASGAIPTDGTADKLLSIGASILGALGYGVQRTFAKAAESKRQAFTGVANDNAPNPQPSLPGI